MALQTPLVLISGAFSTLPPGDTIPASDPVAQASGNAALVLAGTALASGNAGISTGLTALASGNAAVVLASTALASGNAGLVSASNKVPISGGTMTGVLAVTSGTNALPSITFTGDTNTGIYSPGVDQVAVATNGTGRLFIDASGNIGVGISSPAFGAIDHGVHIKGSSAQEGIRLETTNGSSGILEIYAENGGSTLDTRGSGYIRFNSATTEFGRWDSSGRLGIGTTGPGELLDVVGNIRQTGNTAGTANTVGLIDFYNTNSTATIARINVRTDGATNSGSYRIFTANAGTLNEVVRITSAGLVGIGVLSPANQLQLSTDSAGKPSTNTWTIVSDERIKEEIELADLDLCYQAVKTIPLKRFKWKDEVYTEEQVRDRRKLGWIAQDVEAVFPKAVGTYEFKYNQVFEETIIPAVEEVLDDEGNVTTPAQPEHIKQELISEDVIEDCRDLNSDQLYAAMYGAIQKLMVKVENLESISGIDGVK